MVNGSVIKRIEIRSSSTCPSCLTAMGDLVPLAKKNDIPIRITEPLETDTFVPVICFVEDDEKTCFEGYNKDIKHMFDLFTKS